MRPVPYAGNAQLQQYLRETLEELEQRIAALDKAALLNLVEIYAAPTRPRNGDIVFADGTQWDPGSARGVYIYNGNTSAWSQIKSLP